MTRAYGSRVSGFKEFVALGVNHFKSLFEEPTKSSMSEILKVCSLFPR
jgi:hypothetical protein